MPTPYLEYCLRIWTLIRVCCACGHAWSLPADVPAVFSHGHQELKCIAWDRLCCSKKRLIPRHIHAQVQRLAFVALIFNVLFWSLVTSVNWKRSGERGLGKGWGVARTRVIVGSREEKLWEEKQRENWRWLGFDKGDLSERKRKKRWQQMWAKGEACDKITHLKRKIYITDVRRSEKNNSKISTSIFQVYDSVEVWTFPKATTRLWFFSSYKDKCFLVSWSWYIAGYGRDPQKQDTRHNTLRVIT